MVAIFLTNNIQRNVANTCNIQRNTMATGNIQQKIVIPPFPVTFTPSPPALSVTTSSLPNGIQSAAYGPVSLLATGGAPPYYWSATGLPTGLTLSSSGVLSGTPTQTGTFSPIFTATDSLAAQAQATIPLSIIVSGANNRINMFVPVVPSTAWTNFLNVVNAIVLHGAQPWGGYSAFYPAFIYRITGNPVYAQAAIVAADAWVNSENALIAAGNAPVVAGGSYLYALDHIQPIACAYDWCTSFVTQAQATKWAAYCNQCIYNIWNPTLATWGGKAFHWDGHGTTLYGNNYYYKFLALTMYINLAFQGDLSFVDSKFQLLNTYLTTLPEGGSKEGTYYGQSHRFLFDAYPVWTNAGNTNYAQSNTHCQNSILFWLHATVPTLDEFAPIGDQPRSSLPVMYDYNRHYVEGAIINSPQSATNQKQGRWWLGAIADQTMKQQSEFIYECQPWPGITATPAANFYSATGCGQWFWRSGWTTADSWLCLVCASITESHAHQEAGGFALYKNGWKAVTSNIYSKSGVLQQTDTNNIVRFVDSTGKTIIQQLNISPTVTVTNIAGSITAIMDMSAMYNMSLTWRRTLTFNGTTLTLTDTVAPPTGGAAYLQLQLANQPTVNGATATVSGLTMQLPAAPSEVLNWATSTILGANAFTAGWRISVPITGTVTTTLTLA